MRTHQQRQKRARRLLFEPLEQRHLLAPVAQNDIYFTTEDTATSVSVPGVLANDTGAVSVALLANAGRGSLTLNGNGSFSYTPLADYSGFDSFTYRGQDGQGNSSTATVVLQVAAVNDPPIAVNDLFTVAEGATLYIARYALTVNDRDDGTSFGVYPNYSDVKHGTLTQNSIGDTVYVPTSGFTGIDSFTYRIIDCNDHCDPGEWPAGRPRR
jgi:hypothetical protein